MTLARTTAIVILCVVLVSAVPSQITQHYEFDEYLLYSSFVKNTSLLYVTGHLGLVGRSISNEETAPWNVTLEEHNFDGSSKKSSCIINLPRVLRFIRVDKEHLLAAWTKREEESNRSLYLTNVDVTDCKVTFDSVPVPPFDYFPSEHYLDLVVNKNNYSVVIPDCLGDYNKPCKNVYDLDGNSITKTAELSGIEKYQSMNCQYVDKNEKPNDDFIASCFEHHNYTTYLVKGGNVKTLKRWPENWRVAAYGENIVVCSPVGGKILCAVFDGEGSLKHEISLNPEINSEVIQKLYVLPDGFLISYQKVERNTASQNGNGPYYIFKNYISHYYFDGKEVKEYFVVDKIRRVFGDDVFQNDAGEYCVSLFGVQTEGLSGSYDYITRCLQKLGL